MNKQINVPKGKDIVGVWVTGHTYLRLIDSVGETFRFDSSGEHITAAVQPGSYTIETDGKVGKVDFASLALQLRTARDADSTQPPMPKT